jgi:hypothetical protein
MQEASQDFLKNFSTHTGIEALRFDLLLLSGWRSRHVIGGGFPSRDRADTPLSTSLVFSGICEGFSMQLRENKDFSGT